MLEDTDGCSGPLCTCGDGAGADYLFVCFSRLLNVLCCSLDSLVLLESQYSISSMLLRSQRENMADGYEPPT